MSEYVLEVLDGEQAGTVVELTAARLRVGRRPDNDLVLHDEKCSGSHAEIAQEDGRWVLRDLGSTNGTTLDGKRVTEIALTADDVVQFGRIRCRFRARAASSVATGDDPGLAVGTIDAARLQRSRRRGGSLVLGVLFVAVVAAGAGWWFLTRGGGDGPIVGGSREAQPLRIAGNKLAAGVGDFEGESGWSLQAIGDAQGFEPSGGKDRVHSGVAAIAAHGPGSDAPSKTRFALARLAEPVAVGAGQTLKLSGFVKTSGAGRAALRVLFTAQSGDVAELRAGTAAVEADDWKELTTNLRVPRGADRAAIEVLALVQAEADEVLVDDVALLAEGDAPALEASAGGVALIGSGASLRVESAKAPVVLGIEPVVGEGPLADLARRGLLCLSDVGASITASIAAESTGFALAIDGTSGVRLLLPQSSASPRWRGAESGFAAAEATFAQTGVTELLFGTAESRGLIAFDAPSEIRGAPVSGAWSIELPATTRFLLRVVFAQEALRAGELARDARTAHERGRPGDALRKLAELVATLPHDVSEFGKALLLRNEIVTEQERGVDALLREGDDAAFFEARVGFRRVLGAIDELEAAYGADQLVRGPAVQALRERVRDGLVAVESRSAAERGELLGAMAAAFDASGDAALAKLVRDYVAQRLQAPAGGDARKEVR